VLGVSFVVIKHEKLLVLLTQHVCEFCSAEENHDYDLFGDPWGDLGFNNWRIFWTVM
jgi:hypothetical protein